MPAMRALAESVGLRLMVLNSIGLPGSLERVIMVSGEDGVERVMLEAVEGIGLPYRMGFWVFRILP